MDPFVLQIRFIGSSGQPVKDICRQSCLSPIEALELTAQCRCIAPTAPDTLPCYPFVDRDPFCITGSSSYHVYFAGLQKQHEHRQLAAAAAAAANPAATAAAAAVAICIPDFKLRGETVLLSLKTLSSRTLKFSLAKGNGE
ncbi:hypothetical protein ETH_00017430 [Eimeria tenella]|uniref:Uncharacterized protein n=1 Tax=Eimeria tenella TaxID=5802 RepID=U6L952_EIMTE|nr:hypothetical protein ETH_00017430 [Eimeria tenella]CDJ45084.1 hypothetical protein ETH_00017430 [Eimeria tenella]|eukprot:XP_013235831.1 hypothetical protein ETH_00017430 [Eimeria tenella]